MNIQFTLSHSEFRTLATVIAPCAAQQYCSFISSILDGISVQNNGFGLEFCATDGSRLAHFVCEFDSPDKFKVIIPAAAVLEFNKGLTSKTDKIADIVFTIDTEALITVATKNNTVLKGTVLIRKDKEDTAGGQFEPLVPGEFPRYHELFPVEFKYDGSLGIELIEDCKLIGQIDDRSNLMKLTFVSDSVTVAVSIADGHEFISYNRQRIGMLNGFYEPMTVGLNVNYLAHALKMRKADRNGHGIVLIKGNGPLKPWVLTTPDQPGVRMLIMPVQTVNRRTEVSSRRRKSA